MTFTLADVESGNFVGGYATEEAALRDVFDAASRYGVDAPEVLSLSLAGEDGFVAEGRDLVERALKRFDAEARRSA
ncbi:MAG TPA: hypothetical protein VF157_07740 [Chloroflexota bacterium]